MGGDVVELNPTELSEEEIAATLDTIASAWLTMGPRTKELEEAVTGRTGAQTTIATSSGASALHLALMALELGEGDEVIVPAGAHVSAAHSVVRCGATPVLADSGSPDSPILDAETARAAVGDRTRAVIIEHSYGHPADAEALAAVCCDVGLSLVETSPAAGGVTAGGAPQGTVGIAGAISLAAGTGLGVGEGGLLLCFTDLEERARLLRSHAMTSGSWDRHRGHAETYDVIDLGYNYRIDEPRARLALARLERLDEWVAAAGDVAARYREALDAIEGIDPAFDEAGGSAHAGLPVLVADRAKRDRLRDGLREAGIETAARAPIGMLSAYTGLRGAGDSPNATSFGERHLCLPISGSMRTDQVDRVCSVAESLL